MESDLDVIEEGKQEWTKVLDEFYGDFNDTLKQAKNDMKGVKITLKEDQTDVVCDKCGKNMVVKVSRYGKFLACSGYPECKNIKKMDLEKKEPVSNGVEESDVVCEKCGKNMVIKTGRYGKFLACPGYPECKNIKGIDEKTGVKCPKCSDGEIVKRRTKRGRLFWGCNKYPDCDFVTWNEPTDKTCPKCNDPLFIKKSKKPKLICINEGCGYEEPVEEKNNES